MQRQVAEFAGRVNGQHGTPDWVPIRYVNRSIGQATLAGIYRVARVGLVTTIRDGMNLAAKEYVAAHSQKPERFLEMIEAYFPTCRKSKSTGAGLLVGWDAWGNEVETRAG
jgi:trehalose 6-phosphate synthase